MTQLDATDVVFKISMIMDKNHWFSKLTEMVSGKRCEKLGKDILLWEEASVIFALSKTKRMMSMLHYHFREALEG